MNLLLGVALVLGLMIMIHEWGHFIVARLFGVRVDVFSIGFGPRLFGWKRGATDYRISALPFGGYVRSEEHTSELQSQSNIVCRLLLVTNRTAMPHHPQSNTTSPRRQRTAP